MDDVVRDARVMWLLGENGFEDLAAFPLIGKRLVRLGGGDGETQGMENRGFIVLGIGRLQRSHFLLESLGMDREAFVILAVDFR